MKKSLLFLLLALMTSMPTSADVAINETNFPDANFRNYLLTNEDPLFVRHPRYEHYTNLPSEYVYNEDCGINGFGKDGILTTAELKRIGGITLGNVASLKGIEHFINLQYLDCSGITDATIDISSNWYLTLLKLQGSFESIDITEHSFLNGVKLDSPNLSSLNVGRYTSSLRYLELFNTKMTQLDLSPLTPYIRPYISVGIFNPQNEISIIPPNNLALSFTIVNSPYTNLDFSSYDMLFELVLIDNSELNSLILPSDKTRLSQLFLHNNPNLNSLNIDGYTELWALSYINNGFKTVNVADNINLMVLECYGNGLTSLDVSNNTALKFLYCQDNMLTSLDLSNNTDLSGLKCHNNRLTELNLSSNNKLKTDVLENTDIWKDINSSLANTSTLVSQGGDGQIGVEASPLIVGGIGFQFYPSINLSPQNLSKEYAAIVGRSKLGVQCNTNDGVLANYGNCTMTTSAGNNYIVVADEANGKTDVHKPNSSINYNYNTGYTGAYNEAKTMEVNIGTSAHGMYIHPETLRGSDNFYSGTLYLEFPAKIPEGVQCYYAKGLDANEDLVGLTEVTGTIPANTAVIVKAPSEYKFFAFNESDETPAAPTNNIIEGTIEGLSVAPGTVLTLGHNVDRSTGEYDYFGFWNYRGNKISPFRAYIPKSNLSAGAKNGFSLLFPEDGTTGIAHMANSSAAEEGAWYTLSGTRISGKPTTKGIYVNKGQKVVIR